MHAMALHLGDRLAGALHVERFDGFQVFRDATHAHLVMEMAQPSRPLATPFPSGFHGLC